MMPDVATDSRPWERPLQGSERRASRSPAARPELELLRFIPPVVYRLAGFVDRLTQQAAVLFIDVAGFTRLSEILASQGREGAERLELVISGYLDAMLEIIEAFGGLPIKISGDAITVVFVPQGTDLRGAVSDALACAGALRVLPPEVSRLSLGDGEFRLEHKIGVGGGTLLVGSVGDPDTRVEYVFAGPALEGAVQAEHQGRGGEIWVAPEVAALIAQPDWWSHSNSKGYCRLADRAMPRHPGPGLELSPPLTSQQARQVLSRFGVLIPEPVREAAGLGTLDYLTRHQSLTVLFARLPGVVLEDPDSLRKLDAHYRSMREIIAQHGGFLSEFEGGDKGAKLIVLFGAPAAIEDPSGQAARCAMAMQRAARQLGTVTDQRIGLATGRLYVGRIGCRALVKYSAMGDRMNLAARLMSAAGRWAVLAEQAIVEQSQHAVRWGTSRVLRVAGKVEPITVFRLTGVEGPSGRERRGRGVVGRRQERRQIDRFLEVAATGRGGLVAVQGASGVGKTRLLELARARAREKGIQRILSWNGALEPELRPLSAWRALLLEIMGIDPKSSAAERAAQFGGWHAALPGALQESATLLAELAEVTWPVAPHLARLPPERQTMLRQRSAVECIVHGARGLSALLILDGADRLGHVSIQVLLELAPMLRELPLLVVLARRSARQGELDLFPPLPEAEGVQVLALGPLSRREATQLAARHLKARRLDPELETLLWEHTEGNPVLVEAWIQVLRARDQVRVADGTAYLASTSSLELLPQRHEALVLTQLDRLPPEAQLAVRVASVASLPFTASEVAELHPEQPSHTATMGHLRQAADVGLLQRVRGQGYRWCFCRDEVREAIHDSLPFQLRRALHAGRIAQLASVGDAPVAELACVLASHYEYIDDPSAQRPIFEQAMRLCRARYEARSTLHWANRLGECCEKLGDLEGLALSLEHMQQALAVIGDIAARRSALSRWVSVAEALGDASILVQALQTSALTRQRVGETQLALRDLERALTVSRESGDREVLVDTLTIASSIHAEAGRLELALRAAEEALEWAPTHDALRRSKSLSNRAFVLNLLHRAPEAHREYMRALELCEASGDLWHQSMLVGNIGVALWAMGYPEEGHGQLVRSLELKRQVSERREVAISLLNVGFSYYQMGDLFRARHHTEEAVRLFVRLAYPRGELAALGNLGEILWLSGALDKAAQQYARGQSLLEWFPDDMTQLELWLRQGELAVSLGSLSDAEGYFDRALARSNEVGARGFACNATEGLAETARQKGELERAAALIASAVDRITEEPTVVAFPVRVLWRAVCIARDRGQHLEARALTEQALRLLKGELGKLRSEAARHRFVRAFPWNRQIWRREGVGGAAGGSGER